MKLIGKFDGAIADTLNEINEKYAGNVMFNRCDLVKLRKDGNEEWEVTLRTLSSRGSGAGRSFHGRRMATACWHVYGDFLDALGRRVSEATYESTINGRRRRLVCEHGWEDHAVGAPMIGYMMMSEMCDCGEEE